MSCPVLSRPVPSHSGRAGGDSHLRAAAVYPAAGRRRRGRARREARRRPPSAHRTVALPGPRAPGVNSLTVPVTSGRSSSRPERRAGPAPPRETQFDQPSSSPGVRRLGFRVTFGGSRTCAPPVPGRTRPPRRRPAPPGRPRFLES
eukprot:759556-Hanusia_phi.AAC.3